MVFNLLKGVLILTALVVTGCGGDSRVEISDGGISVELPERLRNISAINTSSLILDVSVNDGAPVRVTNQATDIWQASVVVPIGQANDIKLEWSANVSGQSILLADFSTQVGPTQDNLSISSSDYQTTGARFNIDNDGFSNLQELAENRNPLDRIDLVIPQSNAVFLSPSIGFNEIEDSEVSNEIIGDETAESMFAVWHDNQSLNFLMCIQDSSVVSDGSDVNNLNDEYWHDDGVEIYIDAANDATAGSQFDTNNDFQFVYSPDPDQTDQYTNQVRLSNNSGARPICPDGSCSTHTFLVRAGCAYELAVQLDMAALGLSSGSELGLDIEILDDDNGGLRDRKYAWIGSVNDSFIFPFGFGKVRLE